MNPDALYSELTLKTNAKLALVVLDGLGDLATKEQNYVTPLEAAVTPNLDALTQDAAQGRMIAVAPGITPGSGPGHLALFGYDPLQYQVGRGVIEFPGLFRALIEIGYQGQVGLEYEINAKNPLPGMIESMAYMRGVLAAVKA